MKSVSKPIAKIDGIDIATGKSAYVEDFVERDALVVKLLRSPHAFARIKSIDVEKALKLPGVECILTYRDVPHIRYSVAGEGFPETSPYDRLILDEYVRYVDDPVAIIAAEDEKTALRAMKLIAVEYEVLKPILNFEESEDNETVIHPEDDVYANFNIGMEIKRNRVSLTQQETGDAEAELKNSEVVVDSEYYTQAQAHAMMETHRVCTYIEKRGRIGVISSTQSAFHSQRVTAKALGIRQNMLRVIKPRVGGGFGGKNIALLEPACALVTLKTGRPARLILTRKETFTASNTRHAMKLRVRVGSDSEGNISVIDLFALSDSGAYGEHSPDVMFVGGHNTLPIYGTPKAVKYLGKSVYTNKVPAGAFRGFGGAQTNFAVECAMNELAAKLKMDPTELRLRNILRVGQSHSFLAGADEKGDAVLTSSHLEQCIIRGREMIGWNEKYPMKKISDTKVRAVGMSIAMHGSGIAKVDTASAEIRLNYDGTYMLYVGSADLGTGSDTSLAQIAAEVLETSVDNFIVLSADTDLTPYDAGAYASSTIYVTGNAVLKTAKKLREEIISCGEALSGLKDKEYIFDGTRLFTSDGTWEMPLDIIAQEAVHGTGKSQLSAMASFGGDKSPPPFVAGFAEIELDTETGKIKPINFAAVVDCGTCINPNLTRIQAEGGLVQGIGYALYEEVHYGKSGRLFTDSFMQYKIPTRLDIGRIMVEFSESYEPTGPFGAKSIGEVVFHTPSASIADAVFNATGARIRDIPITPEKCLRAIDEVNKNRRLKEGE